MTSIKDYINHLKTDKQALSQVLTNRGVTVASSDTFTELAPKVATMPSVKTKDVNYYDYDGELLYSYTKDEFLALTSEPAVPQHTGMTSQGWNWSFSTAKTYVQNYGILNVGFTCITSDGSTRVYVSLPEGYLTPILSFGLNGSATIDWGDETSTNTLSGSNVTTIVSQQHTYAEAGDYVISIKPSDNSTIYVGTGYVNGGQNVLFNKTNITGNRYNGNGVYGLFITKIELGSQVIIDTGTRGYCFCDLLNLKSINIPKHITNINGYAFQNCDSLRALILPDNSYTPTNQQVFNGAALTLIVTSQSTGVLNDFLEANYSRTGQDTFCFPSTATNITNILMYMYGIKRIAIPSTVTTISNSAFYNTAITEITLPSGLTSIGSSAFNNCFQLKEITIPSGVTSISSSLFCYCYNLKKVTVLGNITSVGNNAFQSCGNLEILDLSHCTSVPTLNNNSVFSSASSDYKVLVPKSLYASWCSATRWSSIVDHIYPVDEHGNILDTCTITISATQFINGTYTGPTASGCVETEDFVLPGVSSVTTTSSTDTFYFTDGTHLYPLGGTIENVSSDISLTLIQGPANEEFTPLKYIQSTGAQWIDTGIVNKSTIDTIIDAQVTNNNGNQTLFGGSDGESNRYQMFLYSRNLYNDEIYFYCGTGNYPFASVTPQYAASSRHLWETKLFSSKPQIFKDGVQQSMTNANTVSAFTGSSTIFLFGYHYGSQTTASSRISMKLWGAKMLDGSSVVRVFTPILDNNGVPCLYDAVSDTCFYNLGTGADFSYEEY